MWKNRKWKGHLIVETQYPANQNVMSCVCDLRTICPTKLWVILSAVEQ